MDCAASSLSALSEQKLSHSSEIKAKVSFLLAANEASAVGVCVIFPSV